MLSQLDNKLFVPFIILLEIKISLTSTNGSESCPISSVNLPPRVMCNFVLLKLPFRENEIVHFQTHHQNLKSSFKKHTE